MQPATPSVLSWMPASEQALTTPCGGEQLRNIVIPTTPRMLTMSGSGTPRSPRLYGCQMNPSAEAREFDHLLKMQSTELMNRMESLMLRQEDLIKSLLTAQTRSADSCNNSWAPAATILNEASTSHSCPEEGFEESPGASDPRESASFNPKESVSLKRIYTNAEMTGSNSHTSLDALHPTTCSGKSRRWIFRNILRSQAYDMVMTSVIVFNSMLMIADTDANAGCDSEAASKCEPDWIWYTNFALLLLYTAESLMVIHVHRWGVLKRGSRLLEIFVVLCGFLDLLLVRLVGRPLPSMLILKLVRLTRIIRGARLFNLFPELQALMNGFLSAMRAMMWGAVLLVLIVIFQSMIAVELMHDLNKEVGQESHYCDEALDSVWNATLLFFQIIVAGDSWGACTISIIKHQPSAFIFLGLCVIIVEVGFMNLIMSVIIERVAIAREKDTEARIRDKEKEVKASRKKWISFFQAVDEDRNGWLSIDEVMDAFDEIPGFSNDLRLLGIQRSDLPALFNLMDEDRNQQLHKNELLSMLDMVWNFNDKMHQVLMSMEMRMIFQRLENRVQDLQLRCNKQLG